MVARFHPLMRRICLSEGKNTVDEGSEPARADHGPDMIANAAGEMGLVGLRAYPQR